MKKTLNPDEIRRILLMNKMYINDEMPLYSNMPMHDYKGATSAQGAGGSMIPSGSGIESESKYTDRVLIPAIQRSFDSVDQFKTDQENKFLDMQENYPPKYVPQIGPPDTEEEKTRPKRKA